MLRNLDTRMLMILLFFYIICLVLISLRMLCTRDSVNMMGGNLENNVIHSYEYM